MTESKLFKTSRGDIHYWISRVDSAPALVFLPGLTADHRLFEKQLEELSEDFSCLVWDAPGHNESRPFELDFTLTDKARWLHDILASEGISRPVLIGQSMGGYVSQCYMELYPDSPAGFISIDSAPLQKKYMSNREIRLMKNIEPVYRLYPWRLLISQGCRGVASSEFGRSNMRRMMESYDKDGYCRLVGFGYRILAVAIEADLPYNVSCPALLLCGEKDMVGFTRSYNRRWTESSGIPLRIIGGAGHNSNADRPEEVNAIIREFVSKLQGERA